MNDRVTSGRARALALVLTLPLLAASCDFLDRLVDVSAPDRIVAETYEVPENVPTMIAGMIADFECALTNYAVASGIAGDELMITDALTAPEMLDKRQWEQRGLGAAWAVSTCVGRSETTPPIYRPISTARWQADNLLGLLENWSDAEVPNRSLQITRAAAYAGYSLVILGEVMCQAPLDGGPALSSDALFERAVDRFNRAITAGEATGAEAAPLVNMARVGLARALLNRGDHAGAGQVARQVPAGFVHNATYSTVAPRRYNVVFDDAQSIITTIGEPFRDVRVNGVADPRVPVFDTGRMMESVQMPLWDQTKYPGRDTPIRVASHVEAQLIVAEAEARAGNLGEAVRIINERRAQLDLPPFSSNDQTAVIDEIISERAAEFFLEGHRFGDIRRYDLPLVPTPGTPYHAGGEYMDNRCFPIPGIESDANPNV